MRKKIFIIPLLGILLSACANQNANIDSSQASDSSTNITSIEQGGDNNSGLSSTSETSENNTTNSSETTEENNSSETSTKTEISSEEKTSEETQTSQESSTSQNTTSEHDENDPRYAIPKDPTNADKGNLPNGKPWLKMPENYANPLDLGTCHQFDLHDNMPDGWGRINGDNVKKYGDFYYADNDSNNGGGVRFDYLKTGLQTPFFYGTEKVELRLHVNTIHGSQKVFDEAPTKPTLILYAFDVNGDLVSFENNKTQLEYTFARKDFKKGASKNYSWDINFIIKNRPQIRYMEVRLNEYAYNPDTLQLYNFGVNSARLQDPIKANN